MWRAVRSWFVNLRIGAKINILLLSFTLTFVGVALNGAGDLRAIVEEQTARYRALSAALTDAQAAQRAESDQRQALQHFVVATNADPYTLAGVVRSTDAAQDAAMAALDRAALSPAQRETAAAYRAAVAAWRTVRDDAVRAAQQGDRSRAKRMLADQGIPADRSVQAGGQRLLSELVDGVVGAASIGPPGAPTPTLPLVLSILIGVLVALGLAVLTARTISRPLAEVVDVLERVAMGDLSRRVEVTREDEIGRMGRALNDTLGVLRNAFDEVQHRATHDALTGLANRTLLGERLEQARRSRRADDDVAVLLIDLDGFKQVNDVHGHAAGDQLLVTVAGRLLTGVRSTDTVARIGGDEFVVVLNGVAAHDAEQIAEKLLAAVRAPVELATGTVRPGASVGVSVWDGSGSVDDLIRESDNAMYAAKAGGKGRVVRLNAVTAHPSSPVST